jgi:lipopolysaccharide transport system ATP-binding protein
MSSDVLLQVTDLSKQYALYDRPIDRLKQGLFRGRKHFARVVQALAPINLTVRRGEIVGVVGRNGSGKSTLLQLICGTLTPTTGSLACHGRIAALLELGAGFNPDFTGRENLHLNAAILGLSPAEIAERLPDMLSFAGIGEAIDQPVQTYSSGMFVRLAFAVAIETRPDLLIVDEALAVGDEAFQRKCYARIREVRDRGGAVLFVSHSAAAVTDLCDRAIWLDQGEQMQEGTPKTIVGNYHKLIFADPARQPALREALKTGAEGPVLPPAQATPLPETAIVYEANGAEIRVPRLLDADNLPCPVLEPGKTYRFAYEVHFTEAAEWVRFGMLFKTKSGVDLGGSASHTPGQLLSSVAAGSTAQVVFEFPCRFLSGTYFVNCGVSVMIGGEHRFLHRIVDACMITVLPDANTRANGMIDFSITPSVGFSA